MSWLWFTIASGPLVAISMQIVLQLADLEYDLTNPHDAARVINKLLPWDSGLHVGLSALFFAFGHWIFGLLQLPVLIANYKQRRAKKHLMDPLEMHRHCKDLRHQAMLKLFFHLFTFCCTLYMLVWTIIQDMIKQEDQPKARSVIMEAIASLH
ncbi:hypothetical protein H632_c1740p1 [Helicosporidium sp. ATCC 50920]|nr:hypothetical protein H632_c1740p1 [Helicosporidium sp. ATCC 50920]|eukprot:KDD73910.1 hypothetical protein H632_c1740p1 [Helicosporidium sp. ATCC 50920]